MPEYAPFLSCECPGLLVPTFKCVFSVPKSNGEKNQHIGLGQKIYIFQMFFFSFYIASA